MKMNKMKMMSYDDSSEYPAPKSAPVKKCSDCNMRQKTSKKGMGSKTPSGMDLKFHGRVQESTSASMPKPKRKRMAY